MSNLVEKKTIGSLFAGIGGIELGFKQAGFEPIWANEIDQNACKTYSVNFNHKILCNDVKKISVKDLEKVDVITAGFPCQAFSIAGHRKGFQDDRGTVIFELFRIVRDLKPEVLFLENVKNLISHKNGDTLKKIIHTIQDLGYIVKYDILNTADFSNVPQNRERIYLVCFKHKNHYEQFYFPDKISKRKSIIEILENVVDESFYYRKTKYYEILKDKVVNRNTCYQWRRMYVRENKSNLCPTLTANMGTGGHNVPIVLDDKDVRKLTPRECARLQGFPDDFILPLELSKSSLYKQIGNSVSVPVVQAIAENILKAINSESK
jgi:DNA (cytosine-5)-methyltransferase 1